jgi:hypothetical protein
VVGAGALAALLAVAALTAPGGDQAADGSPTTSATSAAFSSLPAEAQPPSAAGSSGPAPTGPGTRGQQPPAVPDLVIEAGSVPPHQADRIERLSEAAIGPTPAKLADVAVRVRVRAGSSQLVVRRVAADGASEVWLIEVNGEVRRNEGAERELLEAWAVEAGVVVTLRLAGDPDTRIVAGLRIGGGGTWLRLPDDAEAVFARHDGSLLCMERRGDKFLELTTYQVLTSAN